MSQELLAQITAKHGASIDESLLLHGDAIVYAKRDRLIALATALRDDPAFGFDSPVFVTCTDLLDWNHPRAPSGAALPRDEDGVPAHRFELSYEIRSSTELHRLRIKVRLAENDLKVPTLTTVWPGFDWQERETFDMYGVVFDGHPKLERIYMYEEFVGYPLRRDYPKEKRQPLVRRDDLHTVGVRKGEL